MQTPPSPAPALADPRVVWRPRVTRTEAAAILGVSVATVTRRINGGALALGDDGRLDRDQVLDLAAAEARGIRMGVPAPRTPAGDGHEERDSAARPSSAGPNSISDPWLTEIMTAAPQRDALRAVRTWPYGPTADLLPGYATLGRAAAMLTPPECEQPRWAWDTTDDPDGPEGAVVTSAVLLAEGEHAVPVEVTGASGVHPAVTVGGHVLTPAETVALLRALIAAVEATYDPEARP